MGRARRGFCSRSWLFRRQQPARPTVAVMAGATAAVMGAVMTRAPRVSAPHGAFKAPRMPRIKSPARASAATGTGTHHTQGKVGHSNATSTHSQGLARNTTGISHGAAAGAGSAVSRLGTSTGTTTPGATGSVAAGAAGVTPVSHSGFAGNAYTYGSGSGARPYRAYGYGSGYRNRYYGRRYGYGRSQGNNRAIVSRLRSAQMQLARIDHDYQGHRVRAMHQVSMAIRQLSHRSMIYSGVGFAPGMNNRMGMGMGMGRGGMGGRAGLGNAGGNGGRGGAGRMTQAQSDARMSHSLRTLAGSEHAARQSVERDERACAARGHVMQAVRELNVALSIR